MKKLSALSLAIGFIIFSTQISFAQSSFPNPEEVWVDDVLYGTNNDQPDGEALENGLVIFTNLGGQRPVGEAKPGDKDYGLGHWRLIYLQFTQQGIAVHDPDGDGIANFELKSWEQVEQEF